MDERITTKKNSVLLVENNEGDQIIFREALNDTGLIIELVALEEAGKIVEFVEQLQPRIIFMDLMLPGIGGDDAVRLLKNNIKTNEIPVIFLSGMFGSREDMTQSRGINVDGQNYPALPKPVEVQALTKTIKGYMH